MPVSPNSWLPLKPGEPFCESLEMTVWTRFRRSGYIHPRKAQLANRARIYSIVLQSMFRHTAGDSKWRCSQAFLASRDRYKDPVNMPTSSEDFPKGPPLQERC